jgi:sugar lactone lactonase YvrE
MRIAASRASSRCFRSRSKLSTRAVSSTGPPLLVLECVPLRFHAIQEQVSSWNCVATFDWGRYAVHAEGLGFLEGPAVLPDGSVAFVDVLRQKVMRYEDGEVKTIAEVAGAPNGMRLGPDKTLYIANNGGIAARHGLPIKIMSPQISGRIQRVHLDGRIDDVVTALPGMGPWRPNDLVFAPDGQIIFSDPQNWEEVSDWSATEKIPGYGGGRLFRATIEGEASLLIDLYGFPNGLAFHPDGSLLVAMSLHATILKFPWHGERVGKPEVWCAFQNGAVPDGLLLHDETLYVAGSTGDNITVVDMSGKVVSTIDTGSGSNPSNLSVGAGRLWVTLGYPAKLISFPLTETRKSALRRHGGGGEY